MSSRPKAEAMATASRQCSIARSTPPPVILLKEASPIMPGGAATRLICLVHNAANCFQGLNVFRVLTERELYLGLFEHDVDPAQPVRHRVGHAGRGGHAHR